MKASEEEVNTKVTLPETSSYSYKDCKVNEALSQEDRRLVDAFLKKHQVFFSPITGPVLPKSEHARLCDTGHKNEAGSHTLRV